MTNLRAAVFAALSFFGALGPGQSHAQDVTLTSRDGAVEISGDLLGFDGEFYRVDTEYGPLTVDGSGVTCDGPGCPNLTDFVAEIYMSGAAGMSSVMMPALLRAFARDFGYTTQRTTLEDGITQIALIRDGRTEARFEIAANSSDEGFADLLADQADIALSMREIRPMERRLAQEAGMGDLTGKGRSRVLALDAIVPVVAPGNPARAIRAQDLARVFAGKITNWSELGGPDAPIALHLPDVRTGLSQSIEDRLLKPARLSPSETIIRHTSSQQVAKAVSDDPFAIGLASYAETRPAKVLTLAGTCGFDLRATRQTIKTEDYPLTSPMFLYLPARRLPKAGREFLRYVRGPAAQLVIRRAGFVDQTPEEIGIDAQGRRIANAIESAGPEIDLAALQRMVQVLGPMQRLTTTFRFETGSIRLDAQSRSNIAQLARALEQGQYDSRRLMLVGFSDGEGAARINQGIAKRRAEAVRRAVLGSAETADLARVTFDVDAFGEALPMACDDSAWGRQANRRVEVWVQ